VKHTQNAFVYVFEHSYKFQSSY